ncbi:hypothetical protein D0T92_03030 [Neisseria zalophi]|uniref:Lipoprotein n=2 Tax=Neisseria zalophi TaxID=640030 RepID=A0A5J6PXW8_9NEIS|nr:hypothetical protein D0T92_03030 [Neisseria zalophi]
MKIMKMFAVLALIIPLSGCMNTATSLWDGGGSHSFGEAPEKYLKDEEGYNIDQNGNRVSQPVENPYYQDYRDKLEKERAK